MFNSLNLRMLGIRATMLEGLELAKATGYKGFDPEDINEVRLLAQEKSVKYINELFEEAYVKPGAWALPVKWRADDAQYVFCK